MQVLLSSAISLLAGFLIGSGVTYLVLEKSRRQKIVREYEDRIRELQEEHQKALKEARVKSTEASRFVIKGKIGKIAEQIAPVLPNFGYLPSDARFIGDPIDYIIFNGYTEIKDGDGSSNALEVVILDVKTGKASLSDSQRAIARAIEVGRVRFETVRLEIGESQDAVDVSKPTQSSHKADLIVPSRLFEKSQKAYSIDDIRKQHPRAYTPWSAEEDKRLRLRYGQRTSISALAAEFQRKPGAIRSRLKKLGLL